jgi:chemotaxis protein MotB
MVLRRSLFVLSLFFFLLPACVSKTKYLEANKNLESLEAKCNDLEDKNLQLSRDIEELKLEVEERESVIEEQKTVISELDETKQKIESSMKEQIDAQEIKIEEIEGKLKVTFVDKILFDTGSVEINQRGKEVLLAIAGSLKENESQNILVEGHTDNVPIGMILKDRFPTNWELSTARATAVVRFLQDNGGLEPERLTASGHSYYRPVASNDTEEGRSQNRRIEIILIPPR